MDEGRSVEKPTRLPPANSDAPQPNCTNVTTATATDLCPRVGRRADGGRWGLCHHYAIQEDGRESILSDARFPADVADRRPDRRFQAGRMPQNTAHYFRPAWPLCIWHRRHKATPGSGRGRPSQTTLLRRWYGRGEQLVLAREILGPLALAGPDQWSCYASTLDRRHDLPMPPAFPTTQYDPDHHQNRRSV